MKFKDFANSISHDKKPLLDSDEKAEKLYNGFLMNRYYSFFVDTIFHSNEMNRYWELDKKMQFDFMRLGIRKKKRYTDWIKKHNDEEIELVKMAFGYNEAKALEVLNILGPQDLEKIRAYLNTGGTKN